MSTSIIPQPQNLKATTSATSKQKHQRHQSNNISDINNTVASERHESDYKIPISSQQQQQP
jgi:hypothetical protein